MNENSPSYPAATPASCCATKPSGLVPTMPAEDALRSPNQEPTGSPTQASPSVFPSKATLSPLKQLLAYAPLIALVAVALLGAAALWLRGLGFMEAFMGVFLLGFALVKFFNWRGFASGFMAYDWLASRSSFYAYAYPVLELALALWFLSGFAIWPAHLATLLLFGAGLPGVWQQWQSRLAGGAAVPCACMGDVLKVPVGFVTLTENGLMVLMALWGLFGTH